MLRVSSQWLAAQRSLTAGRRDVLAPAVRIEVFGTDGSACVDAAYGSTRWGAEPAPAPRWSGQSSPRICGRPRPDGQINPRGLKRTPRPDFSSRPVPHQPGTSSSTAPVVAGSPLGSASRSPGVGATAAAEGDQSADLASDRCTGHHRIPNQRPENSARSRKTCGDLGMLIDQSACSFWQWSS